MDRTLSFNELEKLFSAHGCEFSLNTDTQYITITRGKGAEHRFFKTHAHKGSRDSFDRFTVKAARRKLGFADMEDNIFYGVL